MIGKNIYRNNDDHGYLVDVKTDNGHEVEFFRQGGGFLCKMPSKEFHELFTLAPEPTMRRGTVTADFLSDPLPCWSDGGAWNGWGMPYFARAEVDKLIEVSMREQSDPMRWNGDKVIGSSDDYNGEDRDEYEAVTMPDGSLAWGIGAGSWCWDSVTFDSEAGNEQVTV
jgi:hypothetical protein